MGYHLQPQAETDLDDIWLYVAGRSGSVEIANRLIELFTDRFWLLAKQPQLGRILDLDLRLGMRSLPVGGYVIYYRIEGNEVLVQHVLRGSRNSDAIIAC